HLISLFCEKQRHAGESSLSRQTEGRRVGRASARPTRAPVGLADARPTLRVPQGWGKASRRLTPARRVRIVHSPLRPSVLIARSRPMWVPKWQRDRQKGVDSPVPTQVVSNEEFIPRPQNEQQKQVEHLIGALADEKSRKL